MIEKNTLNLTKGFSQTVVKTGNFKNTYISGQIGDGADLEVQTISTFQNFRKTNLRIAIQLLRCSKMNTYIVNFNP